MAGDRGAYADLDIRESAMALAVAIHEVTVTWSADDETSVDRADSALGSGTGSEDVAADVPVRPAAAARIPIENHSSLARELRRAAVSVATTVAEGQRRDDGRQLVEHLWAVNGKLNVVETYLTLGHRLNILSAHDLRPLLDRCESVRDQLSGLIQHLKRSA